MIKLKILAYLLALTTAPAVNAFTVENKTDRTMTITNFFQQDPGTTKAGRGHFIGRDYEGRFYPTEVSIEPWQTWKCCDIGDNLKNISEFTVILPIPGTKKELKALLGILPENFNVVFTISFSEDGAILVDTSEEAKLSWS